MLDNVCRLCLMEGPEYEVFENRMNVKIMVLLGVECEEDDYLPKKVCSDCVYQLNNLYKFKVKSQESDAALRKLIQTTGKTLIRHASHPNVIFPEETTERKYKPEPTEGHRVVEIEVEEEETEFENEEHIDYAYDETAEATAFEIQEEPAKRVRLEKEPALTQKLVPRDMLFEPLELRNLKPPHTFPLRTPFECHSMEEWINECPRHFKKVVFLVQIKLSNSMIDHAIKKCFDYDIVEHFYHPKGQRRDKGESTAGLRLFTDIFEEAVKEFQDVEVDLLFKIFFKNARNCLRARKSRNKNRCSGGLKRPAASKSRALETQEK